MARFRPANHVHASFQVLTERRDGNWSFDNEEGRYERADGWSALRRAGRAALLAACGLGFGITQATAQEGQQVVPKSAKTAADETSWVKLCTKDERTGNKEVCLIKHEGLEPKTGAILVAAAVRSTEGDDRHYLLVNVPTSYSLVMPAGVQIKVDEGEPIQLQYSVCLPTNCQVQMEGPKRCWTRCGRVSRCSSLP